MGKKHQVELNIEGMTCVNCAAGVTRYLDKQGLENVDVNFATASAKFDLGKKDQLPEIIKGIESIGYQVIGDEEKTDRSGATFSTIEKKFYFCLVFAVPLFLHMFFPHDSFLNDPYVQLLLCLPIFIVGLMHFGRSAYYSLKTRVPNMDVLIMLGSSAAFCYSLTGTILSLGHDYLFYETAGVIITLVLLGNVLEHRSVKKTSSAIGELAKLQVSKAARITKGDKEDSEHIERIELEDIRVDDILVVNGGEKVPIDGSIIWGDGIFNEAMITGESGAITRSQGDQVIGGTLLDDGSIKVKVTAVGNDTVLAQIIELVKNAQSNKPKIQNLADQISGIFVPIVIGIAIVTFGASYWIASIKLQDALMHSIAVLVIACPCAMGLATPTAVMVGIGRAANNGILFKGGNTFELLAKVKQMVFDKTGTITTGEFAIKKLEVINADIEDVRGILYSLEMHSAHPIANSIVKELAGAVKIELREVTEEKGVGISGVGNDGNRYHAGSYKIAASLTKDDQHQIYLLKNNQLIAFLDMEDEIKPDTDKTIRFLKNSGIKTIMVSGDKQEKCEQIASNLLIDELHAEKLPHEKLDIINDLVNIAPTAMVGDGINDAPALAKADVGISLSDATQVAIQSAQVILLKGKLSHLDFALKISKHTLLTIKQNLFWALLYNVVAIPIAAFGFLNPMVAALSMAFSDVFVIGNSIRLKSKDLS